MPTTVATRAEPMTYPTRRNLIPPSTSSSTSACLCKLQTMARCIAHRLRACCRAVNDPSQVNDTSIAIKVYDMFKLCGRRNAKCNGSKEQSCWEGILGGTRPRSCLVALGMLGLEIPQIPAHLFQIPARDEAQLLFGQCGVGGEVGHVAGSLQVSYRVSSRTLVFPRGSQLARVRKDAVHPRA